MKSEIREQLSPTPQRETPAPQRILDLASVNVYVSTTRSLGRPCPRPSVTSSGRCVA
jgi:hypothetical protein